MVLVQAISRQQPRVDDTALRTKRVWQKRFDVIEVEDNEASHYLQHPQEWRRISKEDYEKMLAERNESEKFIADIGSRWSNLNLDQLKLVHGELGQEIARRTMKIVAPPVDVAAAEFASSNPVTLSSDNPDTVDAAADRAKRIRMAIEELDPKNPDDWAQAPRHAPRVGRVSEITGFKVSIDEVMKALEQTNATKAA